MTLWMRDRENIEKGREEGRQEATVKAYQELGMTKAATLEVVKRDFSLNDADALKVLERFWKE